MVNVFFKNYFKIIKAYNHTYFWGKIKYFKQKPNPGKEADRPHSHCCEERKLEQPLWSTVWRILKKLKIGPYDLSSHGEGFKAPRLSCAHGFKRIHSKGASSMLRTQPNRSDSI